jgi:hypothetical protein
MSIFGTPQFVTGPETFGTPSVSAPFNTTVGDAIAVFYCGSDTAPTIQDAAGNTYTPQGPVLRSSGGINCQMWTTIATNAMVGNTVTVTPSSANIRGIFVWDWPVTGGTASLDGVANGVPSSSENPITTAPFSTSGSDEVVAMAMENDNGSPASAQSGYTLDESGFSGVMSGQHITAPLSSPQSDYTVGMTMSFGPTTGVALAAFFKAGGAPPPGGGSGPSNRIFTTEVFGAEIITAKGITFGTSTRTKITK